MKLYANRVIRQFKSIVVIKKEETVLNNLLVCFATSDVFHPQKFLTGYWNIRSNLVIIDGLNHPQNTSSGNCFIYMHRRIAMSFVSLQKP